ncbi:Phosphoenolpyruvate-dihydroxyacetone phosphotransferase, ADP-binding subunit DhaL [Halanaerobium saccharolyticum subsp. saccharolyticum DSM 6643]|uniref:phosphoenolpyruvate--glycerone phosphotransferase n=1 Tax=Halanaerobium saccharolyticum subsp. saccharolyticum DSM 6643 TaxID=1293054 RepID=M5DZ01_9FIRM|nr:dihydroxyacetone kinase subunit DhaL [Halanaerobium saccharolyticum]CCU78829.1 Phosphoenolpyruvate-dihydroxyacetone phosphotransferase, ADP-binding subunit DhaL [Halanaerobium saccharolyticum subsp. saccharolyticum DSM 6643]
MTEKSKKIINEIADVIIENKKYLTKLDSAIGDGDHGINMTKGFKKVKEKMEAKDYENNKELIKTVAMTLISTVGGASGPLYGTAFLNISKIIPDADFDLESIIEIGETAVAGIQKRGKAEAGEKTMLDTIIPAVDALKESKKNGDSVEEALQQCKIKAEEGMKATIDMQATKGRASYLGKRSIGHQDPGATSSYLMIKTVVEELY